MRTMSITVILNNTNYIDRPTHGSLFTALIIRNRTTVCGVGCRLCAVMGRGVVRGGPKKMNGKKDERLES